MCLYNEDGIFINLLLYIESINRIKTFRLKCF